MRKNLILAYIDLWLLKVRILGDCRDVILILYYAHFNIENNL